MDAKLLSRLQKLCSRREYCSSAMRAKALELSDGDGRASDELVASLIADKYVDDARFACAFARDRASLGGWGPAKISMALRAKGIAVQDIKAALESIDAGKADARLDRLLQAKDRTLEADPQRRLKLIRYLLGRGYDYDTVERAIARNRQG